MGIEVIGDVTSTEYVRTGLASFDRALHGGLWLRSAYEIYGYTHVGKSTFAYFLAGKVRPGGLIAVADFEGFDINYMLRNLAAAEWSGKVDVVDVLDGETALTALRDRLIQPETQAAILDSVGALVPMTEMKEKISAANMGLKARLMAKGMRYIVHALRRNPACFFAINHLHPILSIGQGATTSGGVTIHNLSAVRLRLHPEKIDERYSVVQGKVDKLRYGGKGRHFKFVILPGVGVHTGLTAVMDCVWAGRATDDRIVKLDGKSFGYFKALVDKAYEGDNEVFEPFRSVINDYMGTADLSDSTETSDDSDD
jgi:RecA/RadA recombinase